MNFDYDFAWSILPDLLRGLLVTLQVVVLGFLLAVLLGLVLAMAQRSQVAIVHAVSKGYLSFFRNTPLMVQLYVLFFALPLVGITLPAISTGVIGLGLYYGAYIAEAYRGAIDGVAGRTMGSRQGTGFRYRDDVATDRPAPSAETDAAGPRQLPDRHVQGNPAARRHHHSGTVSGGQADRWHDLSLQRTLYRHGPDVSRDQRADFPIFQIPRKAQP